MPDYDDDDYDDDEDRDLPPQQYGAFFEEGTDFNLLIKLKTGE